MRRKLSSAHCLNRARWVVNGGQTRQLAALPTKARQWTCQTCQTEHDRDLNASYNLERLATITALPVANRPVMEGTVLGKVPNRGGKVTLVRYECGQ